ncbi:hypothetical protein CCMSSC00406_0007910 [Pleurotus cornucopiae]|uniref:Uncharacterized protein n=1 Tax=Pleurotus cornucopiae TaxID=5321 RepID=A0ACB7IQR9_PLECO|nr:hypothetical protein CCMSSC00406_0007910 [Pleurotus cornucopiae]
MSIKRINREIADLKKEDLGPITLSPSDDNLYLWKSTLPGPQGSPYEGGVFNVEIHLPPDYPFSAPKVMFTTRIYHMNISDRGNICIDILKQNWSPALSIFKVMLSLSSLLTDPNPQDPLVPSIATQYMRNRKQHDTTAQQWVELYARPKPPPPQPETLSTKAKGKRKAPAVSDPPAGDEVQATSSPIPVVDNTPIEIPDSDDEGGARTIDSNGPVAKRRKRGNAKDVGTNDGGSRNSQRRRSGHSTPVEQLGEVIVIDD